GIQIGLHVHITERKQKKTQPNFFLVGVFWLAIVSGVTSLLGVKTRLSLFLFALGNVYMQAYLYSFGSFHHGEAIMLIVLFLFALAPAGGVLSWDSWRHRRGGTRVTERGTAQRGIAGRVVESLRPVSVYARWPLLVTQWLFSIVYLSAAVNKVNADGPGLLSAEWMNGYTLQHYLLRDGLQWGSELGVWLGQFHVPAIISSWFAVLFEATFWLVLPFPKLIWLFIPLGYALHIGIWMAQRAPFFHYLALYVVFIPWTAVVKVVATRLGWPIYGNQLRYPDVR
ncbi:MAG: HTTM domain-containing protein, partial [Cyanobacteria bacterium J06598_3]